MSTKMTLPMAGMPAVITESLRSVLDAHGYVIARVEPLIGPPYGQLEPLDDAAFNNLLRECGNNTTQALFAIDEQLTNTLYTLGFGATYELRRAFMVHEVADVQLLAAIIRLEQGVGSAGDVTELCHLAELAGLPWREMFPDVIPERIESPTLPPSSPAVEERDGAGFDSPQAVPSRSGCTEGV